MCVMEFLIAFVWIGIGLAIFCPTARREYNDASNIKLLVIEDYIAVVFFWPFIVIGVLGIVLVNKIKRDRNR